MLAAGGGVASASHTSGETHLTQAELNSVVQTAIDDWAAAGASASQLAALHATAITVADLADGVLGQEGSGAIQISPDAAGYGWFVDHTPGDNAEFTHAANATGTDLFTDPAQDAAGHTDLLTTVMHEMGHVLGLPDDTNTADSTDLMYIDLVTGERRLPDAADVAQAQVATGGSKPAAQADVAAAVAPASAPQPDAFTFDHGTRTVAAGPATGPAQIGAHGDTFDLSALTSAPSAANGAPATLGQMVHDAGSAFATLPAITEAAHAWAEVAHLENSPVGDAVHAVIEAMIAQHQSHTGGLA